MEHNLSFRKDPKSGAVLNVNLEEHERFKQETKQARTTKELKKQVEDLNREFRDMKNFIRSHFGKANGSLVSIPEMKH
jgi:hypothetical protein